VQQAMRITHYLLKLILIILLVFISGCSTMSYYSQSIQGQLSILYHREKIDKLLQSTTVDPALKEKLRNVKAIRHYASAQLDLPDNSSYLYYTDLHRPYVVWNVFATPEFSLTPIKWCYPIVGCVSYRGYFKKDTALTHAEKIRKQGNDVYVAGIAAYSTLGWFDDPVLNTMINWRRRALAGLIFHELSHQLIYIKNDTAFNEAFSSAVERIGTIQWILDNKPSEIQHYLNYLNAQNDFRNLLISTRDTLNKLYISNKSDVNKRKAKIKIFENMKKEYQQLKTRWPDNIQFDHWFNKTINNARFTSSMTYLNAIPAFYTLFLEANANWGKFYQSVIDMQNLTVSKRKEIIQSKIDNHFDIQEILVLLQEDKI